MAFASRSTSNWILSVKIFGVSSLIFTIALILKLSVPVISQFIVSELPLLWRSILSWLTPPYLYVVVNGIIITIAASSRFYQNKIDEEHQSSESESIVAPLKVPLPVVNSGLDFSVSSGYDSLVVKSPIEVRSEYLMKNSITDVKSDYEILESKFFKEQQQEEEENESNVIAKPVSERQEEGFVISRSSWTPSRNDLKEIEKENIFPSPVSVRFSHHRRTVKSSPEAGKALGVAKPKRHDTLERTWKTITDGRPIPLARHLKKSDTWETHGRHHHNHNHSAGPQEQTPPTKTMKKCETFQDRNKNPASPLSPSPGSGKLKKEPSLSHDELNRRVEAFIKKFNEDMRLQRQESLNQYKEMMVNRR
ncbi:cotton fiber [Thalictrum thalictroides]|uniref:Cotton fiber n=1 Tax=Thalictrum thalictroides TaxID=46969 RepID=A0A7J6VS88_THATH|nr:cotton fiber [Thalictrum thalictroides]